MRELFFLLLIASPLFAEPAKDQKDILYKTGELTDYEKSRCRLDLYLPENRKNFPTLIWLHGGALKAGAKGNGITKPLGPSLTQEGLALVVPNYRLHPKVTYPSYVEDCAAAVAWTFAHIEQHGGDPKKIHLGGHSAGGTLTLLLGMDSQWLAKHGLKLEQLAGLIPVSGQTVTHYTIRKERTGTDDRFTILVDEAAPLHYASRKNIPPLLILWADNDTVARSEENSYLTALLKGAKHSSVSGLCIPDRTHSSIAENIANPGDPARQAILDFINTPR